ncbi:MAG: vWA domain-containing protein [Myxococcota bacterium]
MDKNRKIGYWVLGGLLFVTVAARAAYSPALSGVFATPGVKLGLPALKGAETPPWAATKDPIAPLPPGEQGALRVSAELDRTAVLQKQDNQVHVAVTLDTHGLGTTQRAPTDFVVVFDRSGSMGGQKIEFGKQALRELVNRLADNDRFGLVTYESTAEVRIALGETARAARHRWLRDVGELTTAGGTNISEGLDLGLQELTRARSAGRVQRMLLLSDGLANAGDSSLSGLSARARRVNQADSVLSAIGVGADFDENVMTSLARAGTGAFYYLAKLETLPTLLSAELKTAGETYAQRAELHVQLEPGVELVSASGSSFSKQGSSAVVPLGSLYADHKRELWLTLQVPNEKLESFSLASLSVRYRQGEKPQEVAAPALPNVVCVADSAEFEKRFNQRVWERAVLEEELARSKEQLGAAIREGNAKDVDLAIASAERHQTLARRLGNQRLDQEIENFKASAAPAKAAQVAGGSVRASAAKAQIAGSFATRNSGSYKNMPSSATY